LTPRSDLLAHHLPPGDGDWRFDHPHATRTTHQGRTLSRDEFFGRHSPEFSPSHRGRLAIP
jgi:hypothetical protein